MSEIDPIEALVATADLLSQAAATATPWCQHLWKWMDQPTFGDFVVVSYVPHDTPAIQRVGTIVAAWTHVYPQAPEEIGEVPFAERAREEVWQLELLDGERLAWTNVRFMRIPRVLPEAYEAGRI